MPSVVQVKLSDSVAIKGGLLTVQVTQDRIFEFTQLQLEIYNTCVSNPRSVLGMGTQPVKSAKKTGKVEFNTQSLECGIYEIRLIRFHTPIDQSSEQQIDFIAQRDFKRLLFEVVDSDAKGRTAAKLKNDVEACEAKLEKEFNAPVEIFQVGTTQKMELSALVFVRNVLIGTTIRFSNFELLPTGTGLDSQDALNFVNSFLRDQTKTDISFDYNEALMRSARSSNPVCVVHFPNIVSATLEEAKDYCHQKTNSLLLSVVLMRDAGGEVFEIVLIDRTSGQSTKYSVSTSYVGNMLTGNLAGESAESLQRYLAGIEADPITAFLVDLYKQGRQERNADFQYLRFWQILETLADGRNYDPKSELLDYDGQVMMDEKRPRRSKGSVNTIFALFRDEGIGTTNDTWEKVNIWFALRSSVSHHGAISRFSELSRQSVRARAKQAFDEISNTGHDQYLWQLKEDTKSLLMRRLVRLAGNM